MTIQSHWKAKIEKDLAPFCDPGSELLIRPSGRNLEAQFERRGKTRVLHVRISPSEDCDFRLDGQHLSRFSQVLSHEQIGDLQQLASISSKVLKRSLTRRSKHDPVFVDAPGLRDSLKDSVVNLLRKGVEEYAGGLTHLVFVTGEAGAGKTFALRRLAQLASEDYLKRSTDYLFLYVDAQGRALARFNEALAAELDDLHSALPYHAVAALVRNGLVVPIIDGFDELLGAEGYDDAFGSLSTFMEELEGFGQLVVSARSTYYEQEFVDRIHRSQGSGTGWESSLVQVLPWSNSEVTEYTSRFSALQNLDAAREKQLNEARRRVFAGNNADLDKKPLFLARILEILLEDPKWAEGSDLLEALVETHVLRESTEKLLDQNGRRLLTEDQVRNLLAQVSGEMWAERSRELSARTVNELAEIATLELELDPTSAGVVKERLPKFALLSGGGTKDHVSFEHELFFSYFLAQSIEEAIRKQAIPSLASALSRAPLPPSVSLRLAAAIRSETSEAIKTILVVARNARGGIARQNCGGLVAALINLRGNLEGVSVLSDVVFANCEFDRVRISGIRFEDVRFERCRFYRAKFLSCSASSTVFHHSSVKIRSTVFDIAGLGEDDFYGLYHDQHEIFDPVERRELLRKLKLPSVPSEKSATRSISPERLKVVDRLCRAYRKANPICLDDDILSSLFKDSEWPAVLDAAIESGIATKETRPAGGNRREFLRRHFLPDQIMAGLDPSADIPDEVAAFWVGLQDGS